MSDNPDPNRNEIERLLEHHKHELQERKAIDNRIQISKENFTRNAIDNFFDRSQKKIEHELGIEND